MAKKVTLLQLKNNPLESGDLLTIGGLKFVVTREVWNKPEDGKIDVFVFPYDNPEFHSTCVVFLEGYFTLERGGGRIQLFEHRSTVDKKSSREWIASLSKAGTIVYKKGAKPDESTG